MNPTVTVTVLDDLTVSLEENHPSLTLESPHSVWPGVMVQGIRQPNQEFRILSIVSAPPVETVGIMILFSKRKYGVNSRRVPYYWCSPLSTGKKCLPPCKVASTYGMKHGTDTNVYAKIKITTPTLQSELATGEIITLYGRIDDPLAACQAILHHHLTLRPRWNLTFPLEQFPSSMGYAHHAYTIDPVGCRDVDDAISFDITENRMKIGIHITDIMSLFQKYPSLLPLVAQQPFTLYSPHKVLHCLPEQLSCGEGSLLADGRPRSVVSLYLEIQNGMVQEIHLVPNVILIEENLSYEQANEYITTTRPEWKTFYDMITHLRSQDTIQIHADEPSHVIIDYCMVFLNRWIAHQLITHHGPTTLLRVHQQQVPTATTPEVISYLYQIRDSRASYQFQHDLPPMEHGLTHQGLGLSFYTHFTSPLRRYADVLVHSQVYQSLFHREFPPIPFSLPEINQFEKKMKKVERLWKWTQWLYTLRDTPHETDCYVIQWIRGASLKVELYFPTWKTCFVSKLIDKKMIHHFVIDDSCPDRLLINGIPVLERYQSIHVSLWWDFTKGYKGTRIHYLSPPLCFS